GYLQGTRHGIGLDVDGLIRAGEPGVQLTWMDAKVGDWVVTPRIGKPVEIQALWLAALAFAVAREAGLARHLERGRASFAEKFFDPERGWLRDVVDVDHEPNRMDPRLRPNQVFALGGLGPDLLSPGQAHSALDAVERILWTPAGLRTLDPSETEYRARYEGGVWERDGAYHQGTVWPWLTGPFVDAWVHLRGGGPDVQRAARNRFVAPLLTQLDRAGLGHISEIADGEAPHTPRGAPFQAWSVTELFRLDRTLAR
ncbi:MAG: amylo-alpha-1,6-glucosidase, partial [Myxococcota bacterium]